MLIVVGGGIKVKGKWTRVSTTELLDTTNGCWYNCNSLPSPHQQLKATIMNDKLYLLDGFDKDGNPSLQVFVASLDTLLTHQLNWQSAPNTPLRGLSPVVLYDKLLTVGGKSQKGVLLRCTFSTHQLVNGNILQIFQQQEVVLQRWVWLTIL